MIIATLQQRQGKLKKVYAWAASRSVHGRSAKKNPEVTALWFIKQPHRSAWRTRPLSTSTNLLGERVLTTPKKHRVPEDLRGLRHIPAPSASSRLCGGTCESINRGTSVRSQMLSAKGVKELVSRQTQVLWIRALTENECSRIASAAC